MFQHAKERAYAQARADLDEWQQRISAAFAAKPGPGKHASTLAAITSSAGIWGYQPLSNTHIRLRATMAMTAAVLREYARIRHQRGMSWYLFTATFNDGFTYEDQPEIRVAKILRKTRRLLTNLKLNAICALEIDAFDALHDGRRLYSVHVHGVCWTDADFHPIATQNLIQKKFRGFANDLGVPPVTFRSRRQAWSKLPPHCRTKPQQDQTASSIAWMVRYMFKPLLGVKVRRPGNGSFKTERDPARLRDKTLIRGLEINSFLTPSNAIFGTGEGKAVADDFRQRMRRLEQKNRGGFHLDVDHVRRFWRDHHRDPDTCFDKAVAVDPSR